jgi:putative endonuclease
MGHTQEIGSEGEDHAASYLERAGYRILCRNYRYRKAEIDILAQAGPFLVVVEVKTRTGSFYEALTDSIPRAKINRLVEAAHHFIQEAGVSLEVRFDIIQVIREGPGFRLVHLEDAFYFF